MIKVGDKIPSATLMEMQDGKPTPISTDNFFAGKKVALFALPGAFTPTCSAKHVPGFVNNHDALKANGVNEIACVSVNDAFVMGAWGREQKTDGKVRMMADGAAQWAKALGLDQDLGQRGLGVRAKRYAMVIDDGVVTHLAIEEPGEFKVSSAEAILEALRD